MVELIALGPDGHAALLDHTRQFAAERYQDGYDKGVHDEDATRIFSALALCQDAAVSAGLGPDRARTRPAVLAGRPFWRCA